MAGNRPQGQLNTNIEIPLPSVRRYVPGSGPPPARITLAPPRDSTAYIIDQYVLPTAKDTTPTSRRLIYYHIGFTDLPAVKLLIPCHKVLDYVSPRELEDWEYDQYEKKLETREKKLEDDRRKQALAKQVNKQGKQNLQPLNTSGVPKEEDVLNRGVPEASQVVAESELLVTQVAGPSLSTPKKRKGGPLLLTEADDPTVGGLGELDDVTILRQLRELGDSETDDAGSNHGLNEATDGLHTATSRYRFEEGPDYSSTASEGLPFSRVASSRAGSSVLPHPSLHTSQVPLHTSQPHLRPEPIPHPSLHPGQTPIRSEPDFLFTVPAPTPTTVPHPAWAQAFGMSPRAIEPSPAPRGLNGYHNSRASPRPAATRSSPRRPGSSASATSSVASFLAAQTHDSRGMHSRRSASIDFGEEVAVSSKMARQHKDAAKKKPSKPRKKKEEHTEEEDVWVVKELLDDRLVTEKGAKVRKYLVLWEGDWPPDQNPTWEPASNIQDADLIKTYRKKKREGLMKPPQKKMKKTMMSYMSRTHYTDAAEAFEGDMAEHQRPAAVEEDSDEPDEEEELLVTEEAAAAGKKRKANGQGPGTPGLFGAFDQKFMAYAQTYGRP